MSKPDSTYMASAMVILTCASIAWAEPDPIGLLKAAPSMRTAPAGSEDIGGGFIHHGQVSHVGHRRGMVSTQNAEGESIVLVWLSGDALLEINVETGEYREHRNPHFSGGPFASLLSSRNLYYTSRGEYFVEFDPAAGKFTFAGRRKGRSAMSMIEDDQGVIWAAHTNSAELVSFDPQSREFTDHGATYEPTGRRVYPRNLAADDRGWIYIAIGGPTQIIVFDRQTGEASTVLAENEREGVSARLYRYDDGRVYARAGDDGVLELYGGRARFVDGWPDAARLYRATNQTGSQRERISWVAGGQGLMHRDLPNGEWVEELDMVNRELTLADPETGATRVIRFDYESGDRSIALNALATSEGTVIGGATYPGRFYSYNPSTDKWTRGDNFRQWNAVTVTGDGVVYIGIYTHGAMLEWDPSRPWMETERGNSGSNPLYLEETRAHPHLWRPSDIRVTPDDRHVILAGWSTQGHPGGGLAFWDREMRKGMILTHEDLIRYHNSYSLAPLSDGRLLVCTTTSQWGGTVRAEGGPKLYILDMETKEIEWRKQFDEEVSPFRLHPGDGGEVFMVSTEYFKVFDPGQREVTVTQEIPEEFGNRAGGNAPRVFVPASDSRLFLLFHNVIAELDTATYEITVSAELPMGRLVRGGTYLDGRLYFIARRSRLYSWQVPGR